MKKVCWLFLFGLIGVASNALAQSEPFYKGKTVRIMVGFAPGGVMDLWARLLAQHLGKYIPGQPSVIVQNMTGAGSMTAANYVYSVAKPDGLTLGLIFPALYFDQHLGAKEVQYDWAKFVWIGSPERPRSCSIFEPIVLTKHLTIFERLRSLLDAGPRERVEVQAPIIFPAFWKRAWV